MSDEKLLQLQMARSAYLAYRANMLNNRKIIVGNDMKDYQERQKFIEQLFQVTSGAKEPISLAQKVQVIYEASNNNKANESFAKIEPNSTLGHTLRATSVPPKHMPSQAEEFGTPMIQEFTIDRMS